MSTAGYQEAIIMTKKARGPTAHEKRAIAVAAVCDVRSVSRVYAGLKVRQTTAIRVLDAVAKLGAPTPPTPVTC